METTAQQIVYIPLEDLKFDPHNPRLPRNLQNISEDAPVIKHMLRDESLIELMKSIGQTNYSASEPLLIIPDTDDSFIVVEGNRRLAALKLLANPALATIRGKSVKEAYNEKIYTPDSIPCIRYNTRDEILDYLGYRHITGVKSWGALEKAYYLKQLYDRHIKNVGRDKIFTFLAQMIGSRKDYVAKLLAAFALYERANENAYYGIEVDEKEVDFSILSTALGYENIYRFVGLESSGDIVGEHVNDTNLEFLFQCLYDPQKKIGESRQLKQLSSVLGSEQALSQYKSGSSLQIASYYTSEPAEAFSKFIDDAFKALENAKGCVERVSLDAESLELFELKLQNIRKLTTTINGSLKALFSEEEIE